MDTDPGSNDFICMLFHPWVLGQLLRRLCRFFNGASTRPKSRPKLLCGTWDHWGAVGIGAGESVLWQQCDRLVGRMCRLESLLQTLKLTTFRLETERDLHPTDAARLKLQMVALEQESREERRASRKEVMMLRDQLRQACEERGEARQEVQRLQGVATSAKVDVALAAEELKIVKVQMSKELMEMKEQMSQESALSSEAMRAHGELHRRVEEMERLVVAERRQAQLVQADSQALHVELQAGRQKVLEVQDKARKLQEHCQQLSQQAEAKDALVSELKTELKSVRLAIHKQHEDNNKLLKEGGELRWTADKVQAERSRVVKQLQEQDLLLQAARCNLQAELQAALSDRVGLQRDLEKLKANHSQHLQSSAVAQETAITQRELLERTIERLWGELEVAKREGDVARKDRDGSKNELSMVVTKLEGERTVLECQLSEAKREAASLSSDLHRQQEENRSLRGKMSAVQLQQQAEQQVEQMLKELTDSNNTLSYEKGKLQVRVDELQWELEELKEQKATGPSRKEPDKLCSSPGGGAISQTLENILASHSKLQLNSQALQQELGGREQELATLQTHRLQAEQEIQRRRTEVEKLQQLLSSTHSKNRKTMESLKKALDVTKVDNKRLADRLEQAVSVNGTLQSKLQQARSRQQTAVTQRDEELCRSRTKMAQLSEELDFVKHQAVRDSLSSKRAWQREISELKKYLEELSTRSGDLSKVNQELRQRVSELEKLVSNQRAHIRDQRGQLRQHLERRASLDGSQTAKDTENDLKHTEALKDFQRRNNDQMASHLEETHDCFRSKCHSQKVRGPVLGREAPEHGGPVPGREAPEHGGPVPGREAPEHGGPNPEGSAGTVPCSKYDPKVQQPSSHGAAEWGRRWASTIQRWETKRELARIAGGACRPGRMQPIMPPP